MTLHASIYVFSFIFFHRKWDRKYPRPGVILRNILVLPKIKENFVKCNYILPNYNNELIGVARATWEIKQ